MTEHPGDNDNDNVELSVLLHVAAAGETNDMRAASEGAADEGMDVDEAAKDDGHADTDIVDVPSRMTMMGRRPTLAAREMSLRDSSPRMTMMRPGTKERA